MTTGGGGVGLLWCGVTGRYALAMATNLEQPAQVDPLLCGATAVITHRVRDGREADYERWLEKITPVTKAWPGHLDWHMIRPVDGVTRTFVVVLRFVDHAALDGWMGSEQRRTLIEEVRPILEEDDRFHVRTGLDFWFAPEGAKAQVPVRWKQALLTWSAIYPLVMVAPLVVHPLLRAVGLPRVVALDAMWTTGVLVLAMVYVVMPRYTRLVRRWLFR